MVAAVVLVRAGSRRCSAGAVLAVLERVVGRCRGVESCAPKVRSITMDLGDGFAVRQLKVVAQSDYI